MHWPRSIFEGGFPPQVREQSDSVLEVLATKTPTDSHVFYQVATGYWVKATIDFPYYAKDGRSGPPPHGQTVYCCDHKTAAQVCALLNSSLFYVYFISYGDCFHLTDALGKAFPAPAALCEDSRLAVLGIELQDDLAANAKRKTIKMSQGSRTEYAEFFASKSKAKIDQIDTVLAKHYGFTDEELDFLVNYDLKYRMGGANAEKG